MSPESALRGAGAAVMREWWVVAIVLVVALAAGLLTSGGSPDVYVGHAELAVDTNPSSRYRGVPSPDELQRAVATEEVRQKLAEAADTDTASVARGIRTSTRGNPQTAFIIEFRADDEATAKRTAAALARGVQQHVLDSAAPEISRRREEIRFAEETASELEKLTPRLSDPWQHADNLYKVYYIRSQAIVAENALEALESVYTVNRGATVKRVPGSATSKRDIVGAGLVGLVAGVALAFGREAWLRRRAPLG